MKQIILLLILFGVTADGLAVSVVIPPPRKRTTALLLLCDQLAEVLGKNESIRVVDRTQLDRILQERKTAARPLKPLRAYDLMVRIRTDSHRPRPMLTVELIDLSTGNIVAGKKYDWLAEPDKKRLADIVKLCRSAADKIIRRKARPLRVRLLGVANVAHSRRLDSMSQHLASIIERAVSRSSGCVIVRHLEAMTSKEESLLLHMGLARMGGGRRFLPQADVTVEAEIRETQVIGKTFKQTSLEVRFRVNRRGQKPSKWTTVTGTVANWEKMVGQTCRSLATKLGRTDPVLFGDYAVEMVRRRRQAEAELVAAKKQLDLGSPDWVTLRKRSPGGIDCKMEVHPGYVRIAAAAKIDPTYEEAAYSLAKYSASDRCVKLTNESCLRAMKECLRYLRRFRGNRKHRSGIFLTACLTACGYFADLRGDATSARSMMPERLEALAVLRDIMDTLPNRKNMVFYGTPRDTYSCITSWAVNLVYRGSRHAKMPLAECRDWLNQYSRRFDEVFGTDQVYLLVLRLTYAIDDSNWRGARRILDAILARTVKGKSERLEHLGKGLCRQVARMNDEKLLARAKSWVKFVQAGVRPVFFHSIHWPQLYVFGQKWDKSVADWLGSKDGKSRGGTPVLLHNGWVYLGGGCWKSFDGSAATFPVKGSFARIRVDAKGRPTGKIKPLKDTPRGFHLLGFAAMGNRVFFGTMGEGLYEFNDQTRKWRSWGAREGFPVRSIHKIWPLDEKTLLLFGQDCGWTTRRLFTLDLESGDVKIIRSKARCRLLHIGSTWQRNGKLMALLKEGLVTDLLGKNTLTGFAFTSDGKKVSLKGVGFPGTAVISKRRWLKCGSLYELDKDGRLVRTWRGRTWTNSPANNKPALGIRPDFPGMGSMRFYHLVQDESHLFLVDRTEIICYDPAKDTWYGPIVPGQSIFHAISAPGGIWIGTSRGPAFVETRKFIKKAKAMGRTLTSREFKQRQQEKIDASPLLKRAEFQIIQRNFSAAVAILTSILEKEPNNHDALLVMGFVYDSRCLNKLDEAMKYYSRLAAVTKDISPPGGPKVSVRMTGLRAQFTIFLRQKKWKQAIEIGETFEKEFPCVIWDAAGKVKPRLERARKQLAKDKK